MGNRGSLRHWTSSVVLVLLVFLGTAAPAVAQSPGVTDGEILIGGFGPLTGPSAWIGLSSRDGIQLAAGEINAHGGINGRKLRVIFEGAETPGEAVATAKKLVEQDKVFVLILGTGSTGAAAAADYVRQAGIPTYNIVGATPKIREPFSPNIFSGVFPVSGRIADHLVEEVVRTKPQPKTVGILVGTYDLPQALLTAMLPRLQKVGLAVTTQQRFDLGSKDFTSQLLAIAQKRPDVIMFMGSFIEAGLAIKQAPELGVTGIPWVIDIAGISPSVPKVAGPAAEGVRSVWMFPYFLDDSARPMTDFVAKWKAAYGKPAAGRPSYIDVNGYGDMYVLAYALRAAGHDLTWPKLIATWEHLKDVKPSDFGSFAADVIFPETFSPTERDGNEQYSTIAVKNGAWTVIR